MKTTTVSDLKRHLSARLKIVRTGEQYLVTDRRVPVAILSPPPVAGVDDAGLAELISSEILKPPRTPLDVRSFRSMARGAWDTPLNTAICEERDHR